MIHSLAGGKIRDLAINDFAKVEILEGSETGKVFWYISTIITLKVGDIVLVPLGKSNSITRACVVKIEKNISAHTAPIPSSHAKYIVKVVN